MSSRLFHAELKRRATVLDYVAFNGTITKEDDHDVTENISGLFSIVLAYPSPLGSVTIAAIWLPMIFLIKSRI